ncbi:MAG: alpha-glucosidase/alpha-galactosidase [Clostridia bacterium]|nr:alpha-glucosidase/alpha-galactosidase [Clostridia bacterium]
MKDLKNLKIAYIGGGSHSWAKNLMVDLAREEAICGTVSLYDIDVKAAESNARIGAFLAERDDVVSKWKYVVANDIEDALTGADVVVISILPGTFDEMESDVHLPEKYGIYQSVGDTTGPGGIVRALRAAPMFAYFAENIKKYCPQSWVINFTNPMTVCTRTLYKVFPQIKAFGCCHEVFGTQDLFKEILKEKRGIDAKREEIEVNVLGVNHFTWLDKVCYKGEDLLPLYREFIEENAEGREGTDKEHWANSSFAQKNKVKFDLFCRYGLIAAAGDRHLAEFCPSDWYLKDPETVRSYGFELTPVSWRKKDLAWRIEVAEKLSSGEKQLDFYRTGEECVRQIKAIFGLGSFLTNVNLPNRGQMPQLPLNAVIETNAYFSGDDVRPVVAGNLPQGVLALVQRICAEQEMVAEAALTGNYELAFQAFLNNPNMPLDIKAARELFDEMLKRTKKYLPYYEAYVKREKA